MSIRNLIENSRRLYLSGEEDWFLDKRLIEFINNESTKYDYVSFDVFDTAITRLVDSPIDVMAIVETRLLEILGERARGFAVARENAEQSARHRAAVTGKLEVTLDDIYAELRKDTKESENFIDQAREIEIEVEQTICVPNFDIRTLIAALKVPVLFISDMYHSSQTIGNLLRNCGYDNWRELLVSSECQCTKGSGTLWSLVREKFGHETRILHIGDDINGDVEKPKIFGFDSLYYGRTRSERRVGAELGPDIVPFSILYRSLHLSGVAQEQRSHQEWWFNLGASWGSIIVQSFIDWLTDETKKEHIEHLYFCSRDGYLLQEGWKVAQKENPAAISSSYLYVSRRPLNLAMGYCTSTPYKLSRSLVEFYCKTYGNLSVSDVIDRIVLPDSAKISFRRLAEKCFPSMHTVFSENDAEKLGSLLQSNSLIIHAALKENYDAVVGYLRQEGIFSKRNVAIVDLGWGGTLQYSINTIMQHEKVENKISGFYYGLSDQSSSNHYRSGRMLGAFGSGFKLFDLHFHLRNGVDILETLHSARGGSVISYQFVEKKWLPVSIHNSEELSQHDLIVQPFQDGVLAALERWSYGEAVGPVERHQISRAAAIAAMQSVFCSPSQEELQLLGKIKYCPTFEHGVYRSLINETAPSDVNDMVHLVRSSPWPVGTLKFWQANTPGHREVFQKLASALLPHLGERRLRQFS